MRETAKRLAFASGVVASMLGTLAVPVLEQEEEQQEGSQYGSEPAVEEVTATFELIVEGEAPQDATFFGYLNPGEPFPIALADPDGDGVYVGGYEHVATGDSMEAMIVQGTGSREDVVVGASPGEPTSTIRDFGAVTFDGDKTLSAGVSFDEGDEPIGQGEPANDPVELSTPVAEELDDPAHVEEEAPAPVFVGVEGEDVSVEADEKADEVADSLEPSDEARTLPNTGGAALVVTGVGALLTAVGLLLHRAMG